MANGNTTVSVVVPVYNVGRYLPYCLSSIAAQTYTDLEIILVDDGSTDDSGLICDDFSRSDKRARVIHQPNQGDFAARQAGLEAAGGEYVYFIDGDDQIRERTIELLVKVMEDCQCDMVAFDFLYTKTVQNDLSGPDEKENVEWIDVDEMVFGMLSRADMLWCVVWNKLFRRSLLEGCSYRKYFTMNDQDFNLQVYQKIDKAPFIKQRLYYYIQSENSIQRTAANRAKRFYHNTVNRFRMLENVQPGADCEKYRAWVIDYGYRQILDRRGTEKGTEYERLFAHATRDIVRKTRAEYLKSPYIRLSQKVKFMFFFYFPNLAAIYARLRYGKNGKR